VHGADPRRHPNPQVRPWPLSERRRRMKPGGSNLKSMVAPLTRTGPAWDGVGKVGVVQFGVSQTFARKQFHPHNEVG
jgi:hypothetical protein